MAYITTPIGIARFPHLKEPDTHGQFADNKYKVGIILSKTELAEIKKKLIELTGLNEKNQFPIGADKQDESIQFLKIKSKRKPLIMDANRQQLPEDMDIGGGSKIRAVVEVYPYTAQGVKGVALRMKSIQVIELVERKGQDFDVVEGGYTYVPDTEEGDVETALDL